MIPRAMFTRPAELLATLGIAQASEHPQAGAQQRQPRASFADRLLSVFNRRTGAQHATLDETAKAAILAEVDRRKAAKADADLYRRAFGD